MINWQQSSRSQRRASPSTSHGPRVFTKRSRSPLMSEGIVSASFDAGISLRCVVQRRWPLCEGKRWRSLFWLAIHSERDSLPRHFNYKLSGKTSIYLCVRTADLYSTCTLNETFFCWTLSVNRPFTLNLAVCHHRYPYILTSAFLLFSGHLSLT